jgi:hypothetical protein
MSLILQLIDHWVDARRKISKNELEITDITDRARAGMLIAFHVNTALKGKVGDAVRDTIKFFDMDPRRAKQWPMTRRWIELACDEEVRVEHVQRAEKAGIVVPAQGMDGLGLKIMTSSS